MSVEDQEPKPVLNLEIPHKMYVGEHDDASGNVYLPTYFHFMSISDQDMLSHLGYSMAAQILEGGVTFPVVHASCDYYHPLRVGEEVTDYLSLYLGAKTSITMIHVFRNDSGKTFARGKTVRSWIDLETFTPAALPDWLKRLGEVSGPNSGG